MRPKFKTENPDKSKAEIDKLLGDAWSSLGKEEKSAYKDKVFTTVTTKCSDQPKKKQKPSAYILFSKV